RHVAVPAFSHGGCGGPRARPTRHRAQHARGTGRSARVSTPTPTPTRVDEPDIDEVAEADRPWVVIVWNDPINLMSYVTFVFQKLFGYSLEKATKLMLDVHQKGRAVVSNGPREKAELDVFRLHEHGL